MPEMRRFRLPLFLMSIWFPVALRRMTLPVPDRRKRLATPRCVLIFGIVLSALPSVLSHRRRSSSNRGGVQLVGLHRLVLLRLTSRRAPERRDDHDHVPAVQFGIGVYGSKFHE